MFRIETNQELEAKRIAAMFHHEVDKQDIKKLEDASRSLDILIENVKSDSHIGEATREDMLKEIYEVKRQAQERMKAMNEKRMQELLDLNAKRNRAEQGVSNMLQETSKAFRKTHEANVKEAIDFVWMHIRLETLEAEMNKRFENADVDTRVRLQYVNN